MFSKVEHQNQIQDSHICFNASVDGSTSHVLLSQVVKKGIILSHPLMAVEGILFLYKRQKRPSDRHTLQNDCAICQYFSYS
mmetsp:Transcript_33405/g.44571  ORF Transcript_33405/g.44571 Transcript_33405/m.44571 type:complete len:81 (+) Transcript_33405:565-807(+)